MKGSFSERSPVLQVLLLVFLALGGLLFFTVIGIILGSLIYPYSVSEILEHGDLGVMGSTDVLMFLQSFASLGTFLAPGLLGGYLLSPTPSQFLGIDRFVKPALTISILVVIMTISGTTISDALYRFSAQITFPDWLSFAEDWLRGSDELMADQIQSFLAMESFFDFTRVFFVLAILPALAEETLFRGALQPVFKRAFGNTHLAIWLTAFCFGLMHQQFNAFLSIMALGAVLGYLKEWSGSLWLPVLMHLVNNGSIVVLVYFFNMPYLEVGTLSEDWEWQLALPGFALFVLCLVLLRKRYLRQDEV